MPNLLQLPPELLGRIIEFSMPLDFENLMITCQGVYACGKSQIPMHTAYKKEWRKISLNSGQDTAAAFKCLYQIAKAPIIADYIECADLRGSGLNGLQFDLEQSLEEFHALHADTKSMERFRSLVAGSSCLLENKVAVRNWQSMVTMDCEESDESKPLVSWSWAFLLAQLKNVKRLTLPMEWGSIVVPDWDETRSGRWQLLEKMMRLSYTSTRHAPWSQLKTLRFLEPVDYETRNGLATLLPFLGTSGLEELYATSLVAVDDGYTGISFHWPYTDLNSSLRSVELVSCCMDGEGIGNLLVHTPKLRSFKYSHHTKWHGCEHDWNAGAFVASIGEHCGHQLTELAVTVDQLFGRIINGVTSMKEFECLESVELEIGIFAGPSLQSGERRGTNSCSPSEGYEPWVEKDVPKLVQILPSSLKSLWLFDNRTIWTDNSVPLSLIKDFSAGRDWLLSDLEHLSYRQLLGRDLSFPDPEASAIESVKKQAELNGFAFIAGAGLQPFWRRAFGERHGILADD
ncbi:hypothetical protein TruAng_001408 [Truncatella angustata]|nr:hypothetical protein TruAng_001408 [Truncatella angustata]